MSEWQNKIEGNTFTADGTRVEYACVYHYVSEPFNKPATGSLPSSVLLLSYSPKLSETQAADLRRVLMDKPPPYE